LSNHSLYDNVRIAILNFSDHKRRDAKGWKFIVPDYDTFNVKVEAIAVDYQL
jgi:hypothetical protein